MAPQGEPLSAAEKQAVAAFLRSLRPVPGAGGATAPETAAGCRLPHPVDPASAADPTARRHAPIRPRPIVERLGQRSVERTLSAGPGGRSHAGDRAEAHA